jgi:hypothetical protein
MKVISHRGYWKTIDEKNTEKAFRRSFELGFGTETDIRDFNGELVISHDIPTVDSMPLIKFFSIYKEYEGCSSLPLALNIKSDGLQSLLFEILNDFKIENYFLFDMSLPDTIATLDSGLNLYLRLSEYEPVTTLIDQAGGIWLDAFLGNWYDNQKIRQLMECKKSICIVSGELHKREKARQWHDLNQISDENELLMLCTDFPEDARAFFINKR